MKTKIEQLRSWIAESKRMVFFGGAGVSTESGIPDFRSVDGLYHQKFDYPPETIISHSFFLNNPEYFYRFYREKMLPLGFEPNVTHRVLARLEQEGHLAAVVTQNIDDLHERAGSTHVTHLHGELRKLRSSADESLVVPIEGWEQHLDDRAPDGSLLRPFVVFFGEGVPMFDRAARIAATADLLIVVGTSLAVYPAASLVRYIRPDVPVYLIDPNEPDMSGIRNPTELIRMNSAQGTPLLVDRLIGEFGNL